MTQCLFYKTLDDKKIRCQLCPHSCTIHNRMYGKCGVRYNDCGKLVSLTSISGLSIDPIEKKPLYHFYPGTQILSIGTYGCNLSCAFCQNHGISQVCNQIYKEPYLLNPLDIVDKALANKNCCGIAYTYNEPTVWIEYMLEIAKSAKDKNLANAMVSNGYINPSPLEMLLEYIDAFNIDLKAFSNEFYKKHTGGSLNPVLETLKTIAKRGKHLEITYLVIPGLNDNEVDFTEMVKWIKNEFGNHIPLHINRYFPAYQLSVVPTPLKTLQGFKAIASQHLKHVYMGNV